MSGETSHQEHIGPYRLLARLGNGTGAVHRAAGPDGRDVAIRLLPPGAAPDLARMREVLSPYVVDVLDGEPAAPRPYVVSRFVPGRPLAETIAEQGPMPGDALRRMAFGLAKALAAIHLAGLAHGELGPGTILVVDGAPVVVDFGLVGGAGAAGDVRAWAAAVTFAATGAEEAPAGALPADLRPLVEAAAAADPDARPAAAELAEAASRLDLPAVPSVRREPEASTPPPAPGPEPEPAPASASASPEAGTPGAAAGTRGLAVARGWARLLAAMVVVIAVAMVVIAPIVGLVLTLGAVTLLRAAGTTARGWAWAFGRTLLTVPYAAAVTVVVPLGLVAVSAVGGEIDSLSAAAFGAGAGAAALWTAPGVSAPRRQLERMFLAVARRPRRIAAAGVVLGGLALLAGVGAVTLTPSFSPMYGLQNSVEGAMDRLQTAVNRF